MKTRSSRLYAGLAGIAILLVGSAFIWQGMERNRLQQHVNTSVRADAVGQALEREFTGLLNALRELASQLQSTKAGLTLDGIAPGSFPNGTEQLLLIGGGRVLRESPARGATLDVMDLPELNSNSAVLGPLRDSFGRLKLLVRSRVNTRDSGVPAVETSLAASMDLDVLRARAGLDQLAAQGYHYELSVGRTAKGQIVARSGDLDPATRIARAFNVGPDRWQLEISPQLSWVNWRTVAAQLLIVIVLALAAALTIDDLVRARRASKDVLGVVETKLQSVRDELVAEVEQRERLEKQFSHASFHDTQTGLPNSRHLINHIKQSLRQAHTESDGSFAIIVLELDRFEAVGASIGISLANHLLTNIARHIEKSLDTERWTMARAGEAQFAFACMSANSREAAFTMADRLHTVLSEPFRLANQVIFVKAYLGLASSASMYDHPDDLLRAAQIALANARQAAVRTMEFVPSAQEQVITRHQIEVDLHGVAERNELRLNYQPIVALASGRIAGFEALVRWQHPREGLIPPGLFIGVAEETGLITAITRWVLREACQQAREWHDQLPEDQGFYVSVNLSAEDTRQPDLADFIDGLLRSTGLPPGTLRLEITEGSVIDDVRAAVDFIARLRGMGAQILLDDFGTGYSSLSYLHRFEIDYLKIDQSFVRRLTPDPKTSGVVRAIMHLAEDMNMRTVAEGIETADAMQMLKELKCDFGQGYYFSRPVVPEAAWALLREQKVWVA